MKNSADYPIRTVPQLAIPMPDGVRLGGRLYMPAAPNDGPFPAIVEAHPYRKNDNKVARDWRTHSYLARKGYVGVRTRYPGEWCLGGRCDNEYTRQEQLDCLHARIPCVERPI